MASLEYLSLRGPKRLGDRLLEAGLITRTQLDVALDRQQTALGPRHRLGRTLVELGFLTDPDLIQMLSVHFAIPVAPFSIADAEARAITLVPAKVACRHRAVPCRVVGGSLLLAVADAPPPAAVQEIETVSGIPVLLYLASEADIATALPKHYGDVGRPSSLVARLHALARRFQRLADAHERLARSLTAPEHETSTLVDDDARLRAELEQMRGDLEAALHSLADIADQLGPNG
jgi:type II secretion system (T2SS) protein E